LFEEPTVDNVQTINTKPNNQIEAPLPSIEECEFFKWGNPVYI
jgi:hypothetical protein